jgi:DNA modification methylase
MTPTCEIWNEDCIAGMAVRLPAESVDLCVTSIPFSDLFIYSGKVDDVGNCEDGVDSRNSIFGLNMRFFIEQLYLVLKPGHNACIHIQQLVAYGNKHGYIGRRDFRGAVIDMFMAGGFDYYGETAIPKNPQMVAKRSNLHSLMFATGKRNSRDLAPACNDYVLIFKKPGECASPLRGLYDRKENPDGWFTTEEWIRWARGVWDDIKETDVLDGWRSAREEADEKHVCPLQLEVIRRCVKLYSGPCEMVLDPFMGIGSTAVVALQEGRCTVGFELKENYHTQAVRNASLARSSGGAQTSLYDFLQDPETEEVTA